MRAQKVREQCATRYDFGLWGALYEPIVRLIKRPDNAPGLKDIYNALVDANDPLV
jgi:hypothetical protein